jgi:hypothetical protein
VRRILRKHHRSNKKHEKEIIMNLSLLELRHIIESAFLPLTCRCTLDIHGDLVIELTDPTAGSNLVTGGIPIASLQTSRDIANLVAELRAEIGSLATNPVRSQASLR